MRAMPNMTVIAPGDDTECAQAMRMATGLAGPVYFRLTRDPSPRVVGEGYRFRLGSGVVLHKGNDVALISTGVETARVLEASKILATQGIGAHVLHLPTIKPLDAASVIEAAERTRAVITAEDHSVIEGLGGAVCEVLAESRPTRVIRVGIRDVFGESAPNDAPLDKYGLTAEHVARAACRALAEAARAGSPG